MVESMFSRKEYILGCALPLKLSAYTQSNLLYLEIQNLQQMLEFHHKLLKDNPLTLLFFKSKPQSLIMRGIRENGICICCVNYVPISNFRLQKSCSLSQKRNQRQLTLGIVEAFQSLGKGPMSEEIPCTVDAHTSWPTKKELSLKVTRLQHPSYLGSRPPQNSRIPTSAKPEMYLFPQLITIQQLHINGFT